MNKKLIFRNLGIALATLAFSFGIIHRFLNPDMTDIRWIIQYWYVDLGVLVVAGLGLSVWFRNSE